MHIYNNELYHYGKLGMKWGKHKKGIDYYNLESNKNQHERSKELANLRNKYDNNKMSYDDYVQQHQKIVHKHIQKTLDNAKKSVLSNMSEKEQKAFKKNTEVGKQQADMLLEKIARGNNPSLLDKISLYGFK